MLLEHYNKNQIRRYVELIFRHRYKLIAYNLFVLLFSIAVIICFPRTYASEAKVWIKLGRENSKLDPTASTGKTISIQENDREDEIKSVMDVITSRGVITAAVETLGPAVVLGDEPLSGGGDEALPKSNPVADFAKRILGSVVGLVKMIDPISEKEEAIQEVIENIAVDSERKSNVVSLSFEAESPILAQAIVAAVLNEYKKEHNRIHTTAGSRTFFAAQREMLKTRVSESSDELAETKNKLGIASIDGKKQILENQLAGVQQSKLDSIQGLTESEAKIEEIKKLMIKYPETVKSEEKLVPNTGRDSLRSRLYDLQVQRMEMEAKMSLDHPKLLAIKQQEIDAREELAARSTMERTEKTESLNAVYQLLLSDLTKQYAAVAGLRAKLEAMEKQEQDISSEIEKLNLADVDIQRMKRELQLAVSNYMNYEENFEDARVDEALNQSSISNIGVAQEPTLQEKPVSPSKLLFGLISIILMLMGSAAIVAMLPFIDNQVRSLDELTDVLDSPIAVSVTHEVPFAVR